MHKIVEQVAREYVDSRWAKRDFNLQACLDKYPEHADEIREAVEDIEFSLVAKGLDTVIDQSKSADEIWKELLLKLRHARIDMPEAEGGN